MAVKQQPNLPRPRIAIKHRRKAVHSDHRAGLVIGAASGQRVIDGLVVRLKNFLFAGTRFGRADPLVARNWRNFR